MSKPKAKPKKAKKATGSVRGKYAEQYAKGTAVVLVKGGRQPPLTERACELCLELARAGKIRVEAVQRLPEGAWAPLSRFSRTKCCFDCQSAEALMRGPGIPLNFEQARVAVSNERQEQYRLPGAPLGLVGTGQVRPSAKGDLDDQHAWLNRNAWFHIDLDSVP